jgi:hypothetical protein
MHNEDTSPLSSSMWNQYDFDDGICATFIGCFKSALGSDRINQEIGIGIRYEVAGSGGLTRTPIQKRLNSEHDVLQQTLAPSEDTTLHHVNRPACQALLQRWLETEKRGYSR